MLRSHLHPSTMCVCAFVLLAVVASAPVVARVLVLLLRLFLLNAKKLDYSGVASPHALWIYLGLVEKHR